MVSKSIISKDKTLIQFSIESIAQCRRQFNKAEHLYCYTDHLISRDFAQISGATSTSRYQVSSIILKYSNDIRLSHPRVINTVYPIINKCFYLPLWNSSICAHYHLQTIPCQNTGVQMVRKIPTHNRFWVVLCKNPYK